ncbi:MAG: SPOR domain-containing protein, partial [Kofleriaceae bacterium]
KPEPRYTLQLSAFQDKSEAEAFLSSVKASGHEPYITRAEVDGKGTWYRIRLGSYKSMDAANGAKTEYERSSKQTANIIKL